MKWFMTWFFNLLYHSFAWSYDLVASVVSGGRWQEWVRSVVPLVRGEQVLELGVGTGTLQAALLTAGFQTYGLDESRQMLRIDKKRLRINPNSRLIRGRAEALPLATGSMDTIVATFPSEYIFQAETLRSCRRILRPGGRLVVLLGVDVGGNQLQNRLLKVLYRVTGQGTPDVGRLENSLSGLTQYGFNATLTQIRYQEDILTITCCCLTIRLSL